MTKKGVSLLASNLDRRDFLRLTGATALGLATKSSAGAAPKPGDAERPNILLFITDQQHIDTVSAGGCPYLKTPALDQLAKSGASFSLSYTANPVCSPARSSMLTGRTSCETGVYVNGKPVRDTIPNLGQWLGNQAGYEAVYAGKWHLPATYTSNIPGFRVLHTGIMGQGNLCDRAASLACEAFLRRRKAEAPFLMVASFMQPHDICEWLRLNITVPEAPHFPELADVLPPLPENFRFDPAEPGVVKRHRSDEPQKGNWTKEHWRYYRWSYYRHVEQVDGEIGRVMQALRDTGQDANTLVLFTSDHGEGLAHHQMVRKSTPYDEASKVPMIVAWPGRVPAGKIDATHLVSGLDVMPTLCDYAGIASPENMRGRSMRPLLEGTETDWHDCIVTEHNSDRGRLVRTPRYKYVTYVDDPVDQLFDMQADPGETKNLAPQAQYAKAVAEHRKLLKDWESQLEVAPNVPASTAAWWREFEVDKETA